jgi:hypothetical protein
MKFLKRLFCIHYWDKGADLDPENRLGMQRYTCVKCDHVRVRLWPYGIDRNANKRTSL